MSTKASLLLTKDNEHWFYDYSDDTFSIEINRENISNDYSDKESINLELKEGSQLWECLKYLMDYRRELDHITD